MRHRCRLRGTGWAEFSYFLCYFKMVAPRASRFLPQVRRIVGSGNENDEFCVFSKIAHHSSLIPRSSQLFKMAVESNFPPRGLLWMSKSQPTCALGSLIPLGCPTPPSWGKPMIGALSHSSQAVRLAQYLLRDSSGVTLQNQTRSLGIYLYRRTVNKTT